MAVKLSPWRHLERDRANFRRSERHQKESERDRRPRRRREREREREGGGGDGDGDVSATELNTMLAEFKVVYVLFLDTTNYAHNVVPSQHKPDHHMSLNGLDQHHPLGSPSLPKMALASQTLKLDGYDIYIYISYHIISSIFHFLFYFEKTKFTNI